MMIKQFHLRHQIFSPKIETFSLHLWNDSDSTNVEAHGITISVFEDAERHRCQNKIREADSAQEYMNQPDSPVMQGSNRWEEKKEKKPAGQGYLNCMWTHLHSVWHYPCVTHKSGTCTSPEECCNIALWQDIHSWQGHFSKLSAF